MEGKPKSIVVLSGGQDSVTCLFKALQETEVLAAVHFQYGQRHSVEGDCAFYIANLAKVSMVDLTCMALAQMHDSALVRKLRPPLGGSKEVADDDGSDIRQPHHRLAHLPASFVPGRNLIFLTLAAAYAMKVGAAQVWTGVCQTDYSGYPDCRQETMEALQVALRIGMEFPDLEIVTPLMNLTKAQTFALAEEMGVLEIILRDTHTCYNGDRTSFHDWGYGCGSCPACEVRARGWAEYVAGRS